MDRIFGLDQPAGQDGLAHLVTFTEPVSLAIAEEILHDNNIPYLKKERGCGGVVRILAGFQSFGTDLFVRPEDEEKAVEALTPLFAEAEAEAAEDAPVSEDDGD